MGVQPALQPPLQPPPLGAARGCRRLEKPLVEKPVSGEDHNIYLYYPRSLGGGSKRLFRKVGDKSSDFYPEVHTTRVGDGNSYIYEELLQTEGTDVKVYAVTGEYAHAEARKSPVVDGRVMRNKASGEMLTERPTVSFCVADE